MRLAALFLGTYQRNVHARTALVRPTAQARTQSKVSEEPDNMAVSFVTLGLLRSGLAAEPPQWAGRVGARLAGQTLDQNE